LNLLFTVVLCRGIHVNNRRQGDFEPGPDYGIEFMVNIYKGLDIGIGYKREDIFAKIDAPRYPREGDLPLSSNYILISAVYRFFHSGKFQPYIGFDFGSANIVMKDSCSGISGTFLSAEGPEFVFM